MTVAGVEREFSTYSNYKSRTEKSSSVSFSESVNKAGAGKESVVDEYKRKHPKEAGKVDGQVNSGKAVLRKNGADKVSREDMTMEEYKQFFTKLMNSIPFDSSQQMDVEIWNISEKGWEQMKNDPDYEAWVLGYTAQDRAVHNPFAFMFGYSANLHTEQFGASIEEHLGQSVPMNSSGSKAFSASDKEGWWEKRHKKMEEFWEQQEKRALQRRAIVNSAGRKNKSRVTTL